MKDFKRIHVTTGDMMHVHGAFGEKVDYAVRLTVRLTDEIDGGLLRAALEKTQQRYPYFSRRLRAAEDGFYYEENDRPIALLHMDDRTQLCSEETHFHPWAVAWFEDRIHLDFFHGITDGTGMYRVLATLLGYYCQARYGTEMDPGIPTLETPISEAETLDPQDTIEVPEVKLPPAAPFQPAFTLETDGRLTPSGPTIWDLEIPEAPLIRYSSDNDASPGTLISLLMAHAIADLYPERSKDIISAYVINARPMLGAELTHHNCLGMALLSYDSRVEAMPFDRQCTVYRGKTFIQSDADRVRRDTAMNAVQIRAAAESLKTLEEKKQAFGQAFSGGEGFVSFLVSYTGKWKHPSVGGYVREFWTHPPNTFSLMVEIAAVNGKIFLSIQQRFREDTVRESFLRQLEKRGIPYELKRVMPSDIARIPEPKLELK